jgi:hypothetical protein
MRNQDEPLLIQYELVWKNIEYLDSNILKIVSLYGGLIGVFLSKLDSFYDKAYLSSLLILAISLIFILQLKRTASMIEEQVKTLKDIESLIDNNVFKNAFANTFSKGLKISSLSIISITLLSVSVIFSLLFKI